MNESKVWKPSTHEKCHNCEAKLYISSVVPENGQVNFACVNEECEGSGFIHRGVLYFNFKEGVE